MEESVFYLAEALVVGVMRADVYRVWLLDYTREEYVSRYLAGLEDVPADEPIELDLKRSFEMVGAQGEADHLRAAGVVQLCELMSGLPDRGRYRGRVAISEALWDRIPEDKRPLPPAPWRHQAYRLKIVARPDFTGLSVFVGYHAKVKDVSSGQHELELFTWTGHSLGAFRCELSSPTFRHDADTLRSTAKKDDEGAVFASIEWVVANKLSVGKVPYNAGEAKQARAKQDGLALREPTPRRNIVIVSAGGDAWLRDVRERLEDEYVAGSRDAVVSALRTALDEHPHAKSIELVSHSIATPGAHENLLKIGSWIVDAASVGPFESLKERASGKTLRLVGCSTARGQPAYEVLEAFEAVLGVRALGTTSPIGLYDLTPEGSRLEHHSDLFVRPATVIPVRALDPAAFARMSAIRIPWPVSASEHDGLMSGLDAASAAAVRNALSWMSSAIFVYRRAALLVLPEHSLELRDESGAGVGWLQLLANGEAIRLLRTQGGETIEDLLFVLVQMPEERARLAKMFMER